MAILHGTYAWFTAKYMFSLNVKFIALVDGTTPSLTIVNFKLMDHIRYVKYMIFIFNSDGELEFFMDKFFLIWG